MRIINTHTHSFTLSPSLAHTSFGVSKFPSKMCSFQAFLILNIYKFYFIEIIELIKSRLELDIGRREEEEKKKIMTLQLLLDRSRRLMLRGKRWTRGGTSRRRRLLSEG